jgi:hypothetical protein
MADDKLTAELAAISDRARRVVEGRGNVGGLLAINEAKDDVPRLLAALDVVLKAHRDVGGRCAWCRNPDGQRQKFPCGEYLAITAELTRTGADHD